MTWPIAPQCSLTNAYVSRLFKPALPGALITLTSPESLSSWRRFSWSTTRRPRPKAFTSLVPVDSTRSLRTWAELLFIKRWGGRMLNFCCSITLEQPHTWLMQHTVASQKHIFRCLYLVCCGSSDSIHSKVAIYFRAPNTVLSFKNGSCLACPILPQGMKEGESK